MARDAQPEGFVDRLYQELKAMAVSFALKPDERVNESELALRLNASRTPLREALNRLAAEGLLTFQPRKGFFCRPLQPKMIFDLYEARLAVERMTVSLACERTNPKDIRALRNSLESVRPGKSQHDVESLVGFDETLHLGIARLTGNDELVRILESIQERIRFVRWIDMEDRRQTTFGEHLEILDAIQKRNKDKALALIEEHVERRAEQITAVVREGYSRIYIPQISA
ncbi:MAG: GntR family transcriptional regulator [Hyphomicrobiaceae bacterium]